MSAPGSAPDSKSLEFKALLTRRILFLLLIIGSTIPLFMDLSVPNKPTAATVDLYSTIMGIPNGSTVLVQTDWTNSTRAESGGEFEALVRVLMRKDCKLAIYSMGDPQAPQVATNEIQQVLNPERIAKRERPYKPWDDYVSIGFFPNAEGATAAMATNLRAAWSGRKDVNDQDQFEDVFHSPVLNKIQTILQVPLIAVVTPSNTFNVLIERLSKKVPIVAMVTGVMGPESTVYYASGQIQGLATGLKGVIDLETMMEHGIDTPDKNGQIAINWPGHPPVAGFPGEVNYGKGKLYFPTLHVDMTILILAVIFGNVGMFISRKKGGK